MEANSRSSQSTTTARKSVFWDRCDKLNYPIYFVTGTSNEDFDFSLSSEVEIIDVELSSSDDDDVSLSKYEVVQVNQNGTEVKVESKPAAELSRPAKSALIAAGNTKTLTSSSYANPSNDFENKSRRKSAWELDRIIALWTPLLKCMVCSKYCSNFTLLQKHFYNQHRGEQCYIVCCERKLTQRSKIEEHFCQYHSDVNPPKDQAKQISKVVVQTEEIDAFLRHYMPSIKCPICSAERPGFLVLQEHFRQRHPGEECHIVCCQRKLTALYRIAEHIRIHIDSESFKCELCGKCHLTKLGLDRHLLAGHSITNSSIYQCRSPAMWKLRSIARTRNSDLDHFISLMWLQLNCVVCGKTFYKYTYLQMHYRKEHPKNDCYFLCCNQKLRTHHELEEHIHLHKDPKGFKCEICESHYLTRSSLYNHMCTQHPIPIEYTDDADSPVYQSQPGEEVPICNILDVRPAKSIDVLLAQLKFTVKCGECHKLYTTFTILKQHFRREHPRIELYFYCCERKLTCHRTICTHLNQHIDEEVTGIVEDVPKHRTSFRKLDEMIAQWRPNLKCDLCKKTFPTFTMLRQHFLYKHPNNKCYIVCCKRKFTKRYLLEEHIRLHNNPNAFKCPICGKCSKSQLGVRNHMKYCHPDECGLPQLKINNEIHESSSSSNHSVECGLLSQAENKEATDKAFVQTKIRTTRMIKGSSSSAKRRKK